MKKLYLALLAMAAVMTTSMEVLAQDNGAAANQTMSKKEIRKAIRDAENEAIKARVSQGVENQQFMFVATELVSSGRAAISNIKLNSLWEVRVNDGHLRVYLPIYGASAPFSQPSIFNRLDFTSTDYTYEVQKEKNGGYYVTIKTTDLSTNKDYTLNFNVSPMGQNSNLQINSTFTGPVSFSGNVNYLM